MAHPFVPELEVKEPEEPKYSPSEFIVTSLLILKKFGLNLRESAWVVANTCGESARGQRSRGNNYGGVKAIKGYKGKWYQAPGHTKSGDAPICYYRVWDSIEAFYEYWVKVYIPKVTVPGPAEKTANYKLCGYYFWKGEYTKAFDAMIGAEYKGPMTRDIPERRAGSTARHASLIEEVIVVYLQHKLGVVADGKFGPKSKAALASTNPGFNWEEAATRYFLEESPS